SLFAAVSATRSYAAPEVVPPLFRARDLCAPGAPEQTKVLSGLWQFYISRGDPWSARALAEEILALALQRRAPRALLAARLGLGISSVFLGEHRAAREHIETGLGQFDRAEHAGITMLGGADFEVQCLCYLAVSLWIVGLADRSAATLRRALDVADGLG